MPGEIEIVFHEESGFPDPVQSSRQVNVDQLAVHFLVILKRGFVFNSSVLVIFQTVQSRLAMTPYRLVFEKYWAVRSKLI